MLILTAVLRVQGEEAATPLTLTSPAFVDGGAIPARFTCEGADLSPPLAWSGVPPGTRSLAVIVDDPDAPDPLAPKVTWVHWVVINVPAATAGLPAGASPTSFPAGASEGVNDWRHPGYRGPCPPIGRHRYVHKLYALDAVLEDLKQPTKPQVEAAMRGHILAQAMLVGTYEKQR
ncbi:MAG: YbhB/YbcL family Raf kinase inhibitor-like protein [Lentisphaerae bacterium]|nr:YbhB/YbcL family Raf kinase inhibitor-like protein [Lentisphaerota bacterium]